MFSNLNAPRAHLWQHLSIAIKHLSRHGLRYSAASLWRELRFDLANGVDTTTPHYPARSAHSVHYQGADPQTVQEIFALLPPKAKTATFVDFGCGKGRVLILARQNGFKHVIGIEIAPELATICQRNLAKAPCTRDREQVQIIQTDAATFRPPPGVVCAFFFNPFHGPPLHRVISNLRENAECSRSEVWVIYVNPVHLNSFLEQGFKIIHSLTYRQNPLAVIAHLSPSTLGEDAHL